MTDALERTLLKQFYTRAELIRAVGLLREVLSYVCFTKGKSPEETPALLSEFEGERQVTAQDKALVRSLPDASWKAFTKDTFQDVLDELVASFDALPVIALTVPLELDSAHIKQIGEWAREHIGERVIIDLEVDTALGVGCRFRWKHKLYDYSLAHYLERSGDDVRVHIAKRLAALKEKQA